ncbi:2-oxo acid dehydrogenase subunit E2 [Catenulispora sp. NF23]|uniref:2-oxo acid dehydrogenase subunit E2 n=1 Tax=Catenulispora pinistramenti TaxID=2705254 RepID=UPI001BACDC01|nr:2-oxo acid dehydrogenase subunit E2 [Catenulispora pinistramenti]MBS2531691.1 2-oxo acid dehydrogenase subunit E2 [Catenulispora pinistramenti]
MRSEGTTTAKTATRIRGVEIHPLPADRRLAIGAARTGHRRTPLHYLVTADVTTARRIMAMSPDTFSLTAFIAVSVARAAAEHPTVHAYRDWRGRLVTHHHVDVMVPVQTQTEPGHRIVPHVVTDADLGDVVEVSTQLLSTNDSPAYGIERLCDRLPGLTRVPGLLRAMYTVQDRSVRLRQRTGTVAVTTTGMRNVGETFGIAMPALMPLQVTVGSVCSAPHRTSNIIEQHEILNLTLTFDHYVVEETEAAAFATRLCDTIEHAEALQAHIAKKRPSQPPVPAPAPEPAPEPETTSPIPRPAQ